jgi:hypothetical protein
MSNWDAPVMRGFCDFWRMFANFLEFPASFERKKFLKMTLKIRDDTSERQVSKWDRRSVHSMRVHFECPHVQLYYLYYLLPFIFFENICIISEFPRLLISYLSTGQLKTMYFQFLTRE